MSTAATSSSISPVARFGLTLPSSRRTTCAGGGDHVLGPQPLGGGVRLRGGLGMEDELDQPAAVAQVDEDQPAVVAPAVDPAGDAHGLADAPRVELAAPRVAVRRSRAAASQRDLARCGA